MNTAIFARDVARVISDLPAYFIWKGHTIDCAASDMSDGNELGEFGMSAVPSVQLVFLLATITGDRKPVANDTLAFDGRDLRISSTMDSPCGTVRTITAVNKNK
jgi:hypothetical protein